MRMNDHSKRGAPCPAASPLQLSPTAALVSPHVAASAECFGGGCRLTYDAAAGAVLQGTPEPTPRWVVAQTSHGGGQMAPSQVVRQGPRVTMPPPGPRARVHQVHPRRARPAGLYARPLLGEPVQAGIDVVTGPPPYIGDGAVAPVYPEPVWKLCQIGGGRNWNYNCGPYDYYPYGEYGYRPLGTYWPNDRSPPVYGVAPDARVLTVDPDR